MTLEIFAYVTEVVLRSNEYLLFAQATRKINLLLPYLFFAMLFIDAIHMS